MALYKCSIFNGDEEVAVVNLDTDQIEEMRAEGVTVHVQHKHVQADYLRFYSLIMQYGK